MGNVFTRKLTVKDLFKILLILAVIFFAYAEIKLLQRGTIIVAVGDIAKVNGKQMEVADLITRLHPRKVLTLGDNAYDRGTSAEFSAFYEPSFGAFKSRTAPSPGNHEYLTPNASGYFDYFGELAGPDRRGYYSFDMGSWHLVSLNSEIVNEAQLSWLENDLKNSTKPCILAYFHKPLFSSGADHGGTPKMKEFWDILYKYRADLVLNGHEHTYERFKKQTPEGVVDEKGIRQFIVGTGGADTYDFAVTQSNSEARATRAYGALEIKLEKNGYRAIFKTIPESGYSDEVSDTCN